MRRGAFRTVSLQAAPSFAEIAATSFAGRSVLGTSHLRDKLFAGRASFGHHVRSRPQLCGALDRGPSHGDSRGSRCCAAITSYNNNRCEQQSLLRGNHFRGARPANNETAEKAKPFRRAKQYPLAMAMQSQPLCLLLVAGKLSEPRFAKCCSRPLQQSGFSQLSCRRPKPRPRNRHRRPAAMPFPARRSHSPSRSTTFF